MERKKFEFVYKRSVFRHFSAYYKHKFVVHTENKKVHQTQLLNKTQDFI